MLLDRKALTLLGRIYFALCKAADTPVSLGMWLRFKNEEFSQLVSKSVEPSQYISRDLFERDYLVVKYLSKYKDLPTGIDIEKVALESWKDAEHQCAKTNETIRLGRIRGFSPRVEAVLFTAKRKIASLLGRFDLVEAVDGCRWGPGSTFSLKGEYATLSDKIRENPITVTHRALPYIRTLIESDPHWCRAMLEADVVGPLSLLPVCFTAVRGCRATLVDKSAKTKRAIAIEPTGNIFLQLGLGAVLRKRLKRVGIDLDDQTRNQDLALQGSITNGLATIDLSSASDTVSRELVFELLPLDWSLYMDQIRSPELTWDKKTWLKLEKFSSMGNGFTFELESLIFWSLTSACAEVLQVEEAIGIFGDDIICSSRISPLLLEVLSLCGFSTNKEKSFVTGYFRESCGKHFWNGYDVTPAYQKEFPGKPEEIYRTCNRLYRYASRHTAYGPIANRSWVSASWLSAIEVVCELAHKGSFFPRRRGKTPRCHDAGITWRDDARKRGFGVSSFTDVLLYLASKRIHVIPFGDPCDDGLMLPYKQLGPFVLDQDVKHRAVKLNVYSFVVKKRKLHTHDCLLAYWLRFGGDEPFNGAVTPRRRGSFRSRRRWFYNGAYVEDLSTLDVALVE